MLDDDEASEKLRAAIAAYVQLERFNTTSTTAIQNSVPLLDPKVIGGLIAGLLRAGLLERAGAPMRQLSVAAQVVDRPNFVRGPMFPKASV